MFGGIHILTRGLTVGDRTGVGMSGGGQQAGVQRRQEMYAHFCETKPIGPESGVGTSREAEGGHMGNSAKQSQFALGRMNANPFWRKGLWEKDTDRAYARTKPIPTAGPAVGTGYSTRRPRACCAKQSQSWEGWGIWERPNRRARALHKGTERAKQSQFAWHGRVPALQGDNRPGPPGRQVVLRRFCVKS